MQASSAYMTAELRRMPSPSSLRSTRRRSSGGFDAAGDELSLEDWPPLGVATLPKRPARRHDARREAGAAPADLQMFWDCNVIDVEWSCAFA
eukprot:9433405-Pyramimonas_sp.AAC.1